MLKPTRPVRSASIAFAFLAAASLLDLAVCSSAPAAGAPVWVPRRSSPLRSPDWSKVDQLVKDQKHAEALATVERIRKAAAAHHEEAEWTEALVKSAELTISLHGYETAVRLLHDEPWPKDTLSQVTLKLFYAHALTTYVRAYSWEINQREKVDTHGAADLKAWTKDQIVAEATRAFADVWNVREPLGREPVATLSGYLKPNNYPPHLRDTLRDAVSYLAVALFADSSLWRADEENQVFRLDYAKLLAGDPAATSTVKLDDAAAHPLTRLFAILDDLEAWHARAGHTEAALEARLERSRRLSAAFTSQTERAQLEHDLEARIDQVRAPWWSMGMVELARLAENRGDLVRAHTLALEGAKKFPGSVGGQRAAALAKRIEAPDFSLSGMASDGPRKRSLEVTHKNLGALVFRAYPVDLLQRVTASHDYNLLPSGHELRDVLQHGRPVAEWQEALPATPDFQSHHTFVTPPLDRPGLYVIAASADPRFSEKHNRVLAATLIVTDLVIVAHSDATGGAYASVFSGATGKPASADVDVYEFNWNRSHQRVETQHTDASGLVHLSPRNGNSHFLIARHGADVALDANYLSLYRPGTPSAPFSSLVYTDRSVYRPLQKLLWKLVAYRGRPDRTAWKVAPAEKIEVSLNDANGQSVAKKTITTNSFGSASGEFDIPSGRLLGTWSVVTNQGGAAQVRVEEYKRPTFEVAFLDASGALRLNHAATLTGDAKYYFGLPVTSGTVRWRITREPVYPWWWGYSYGAASVQTQTIATGVSPLGADGNFQITFVPEAGECAGAKSGAPRRNACEEVSYRYLAAADLTDEGGETRSASRSFRLGYTTVEASVATPVAFFRARGPRELTITRTNLDGAPRAGKGFWRLYPLVQPQKTLLPADEPAAATPRGPDAFATPGDALRRRHAPGYDPAATLARFSDGPELAHGELTHDDKGTAHLALPELAPGAFRLRYQTHDDFGARFETWKDLIVAAPAGQHTPLALPLYAAMESSSIEVGGTARLLVASGLPDQDLFVDLYRDNRFYERRRLTSDGPSLVELPIGAGDRGGFGAIVTLVRDHQLLSAQEQLFVPWTSQTLSLEFATFRDRIRPGAKETWRVTVKPGKGGAPVDRGVAELVAYMYDRSLDLFAPHSAPSPLSLYPSRTGLPWSQTSLSQSFGQALWDDGFAVVPGGPVLHGDELVGFGGYGIGGPGARFGLYRMAGEASDAAAPVASAAAPAPPPAEASGGVPARGRAVSKASADLEQKPAEPSGPASSPVRSNFAETAFFRPHLLTDASGGAVLEFTVPDSVTSWNVWVHAVTRDLRSGSLHRETRSVKDLMVRPYLPRFFREGDTAQLKVLVNNASEHPIAGDLDFDVTDADGKSALALFGIATRTQKFTVAPGHGTPLTFAVTAPKRVGTFAFRVVARSKDFSDGELRPLPVLPGRLHLAQSRFVTLRDQDKRTMEFADLAKNDDPSRVDEQLVVTLDTQLFFTVLQALPYLVHYPYECTEQTLNRFLSTGIVSSLYSKYPAVAKMAKEFSAQRSTLLEKWDAPDPNRKMTLEESPWLNEAGGLARVHSVLKVLDPEVASAQRASALAKLQKDQTASGAWPWFPGGPPSPYITLYLLHGFAKAAEFKVDVPKPMVVRGWRYLAEHFHESLLAAARARGENIEFLTFLNYVLSAYPDDSWTGGTITMAERKETLDLCFKKWREHSPYLKGLLALTLKRMGRAQDAELVFASVMDSAKTAPDQGTFWAPEDRSWLWYEDTIESHAFALRALTEIDPKNAKRDGLVLWLLLNKKLNQWKSTRATAEVIYSLVHYLEAEGALGVREQLSVAIGNRKSSFTFEPDHYDGKTQVVLRGPEIDPKTSSRITVEKTTKGFAFASATWQFSTDKLPAEARGDFFSVERSYFRRVSSPSGFTLEPLAEGAAVEVGDQIEVRLSLRAKHSAEYVHLRDPRAAGLEPENPVSQYKWDLGIGWYEETRDSGSNFFFESLPAGEYTFKYRLRANLAGTFRVGPATIQSLYAPEFNAYSAGNVLTVKGTP